MAASFPTALQRTSDERWVTLDVVQSDDVRVVARLAEAPEQVAVVRPAADAEYDRRLRRLLATPPPDAGRDVRMAWPVDLLHDLDGVVVGYTTLRSASGSSVPLADFVDPSRRAELAPMATRRHLLRAARNTAAATAALHHVGHARVRAHNLRVDDRAGAKVVQVDELEPGGSPTARAEDERWLGRLVVRLLSGQPLAAAGELAELLDHAGRPGAEPVSAQRWFHVLLDAERALPAGPATSRGAAPPAATRPDGTAASDVTAASRPTSDLATALARAEGRRPTGSAARSSRADAVDTADGGVDRGSADRGPDEGPRGGGSPSAGPPTAQADGRERTPTEGSVAVADRPMTLDLREDTGPAPAGPAPDRRPLDRPDPAVTVDPEPVREPAPQARASGPRRPSAPDTGTSTASSAARGLFSIAAGLTVGLAASVAPFAVFLVAAVGLVLHRSVDVGHRKGSRGPHQVAAITLSRLVPFATGGLALAAFVLLDLLLVLGLCMALAERIFGYGPGFTITWILQLPEVPGLVRAFAFAVGAFAGGVVAGRSYDRGRSGDRSRRQVLAPAIALCLAAAALLSDASVVWWPLPVTA